MTKTRDPRKICSRIGFALFAMLMVELVLSYVVTMVAANMNAGWLTTEWGVLLGPSLSLYVVGAGVYLLILKGIPEAPKPQSEPVKVGPGKYALLMLFCFGASYVASYAMVILLTPFTGAVPSIGTSDMYDGFTMAGYLSNLVFAVLLPATVEEFLFRYMIRRKMGGCGDKTYILFSSFCFSLFHLDMQMIPYTFIVGVVFAWVYVKTGNILYPISMHFVFNGFSQLLIPFLYQQLGAVAETILMIWMLVAIVVAVVLFFVFRKKIFATFSPPSENIWPSKQTGLQVSAALAGYAAVPYNGGGYYAVPGAYTAAPYAGSYAQGYVQGIPQQGYAPPAHAPQGAYPQYTQQPYGYAHNHSQPPYSQPYGSQSYVPGQYGTPPYGWQQPYSQPYAGFNTQQGGYTGYAGQQAYGQDPGYAQPGYPPAAGMPGYGGYNVYYKPPGAAKICLGNAGMITFMVVVGAVSLLASIFLPLMLRMMY